MGVVGGVAGTVFNKYNPRVVARRKGSALMKQWPITEVLFVCVCEREIEIERERGEEGDTVELILSLGALFPRGGPVQNPVTTLPSVQIKNTSLEQ